MKPRTVMIPLSPEMRVPPVSRGLLCLLALDVVQAGMGGEHLVFLTAGGV